MAKTKKTDVLKDKALDYLKKATQSNAELVDNYGEALDTYLGAPYGNEIEGRSQVVMTDVADTIEWIMPSLMKIFFGGSSVVDIKPQGAEDEEAAKLMEEKINFDVQRGINGYMLMHDWFKTAMLAKYSVVKYWWEDRIEKKTEDYQELNDAEFQELVNREDYEIKKVTETIIQEEMIDALGMVVMPAITSYDVTGYKLTKISKPMAKVVPPEEFIFDLENSGSIQESEFCAHKRRVHKNYLQKWNINEPEINAEVETFENDDVVKEALFRDLGGVNFVRDENDSDFYYIYECFLNDYDEKGNKIPKKVVVFGNRVLEVTDNSYQKPPFAAISTVRIPHRAAGLSMVDLVADLQKLKTALMRAILDNAYYQNNGIDIVNPYRINMDDVIDRNEPGAKWRTLYDVDPNTVVASKNPTPLPQQVFSLLQVVEDIKERRTGVTSYNQGLDSKSLNKTATGISQIMGAAQQRMEMIARNFAETGVKELFQAFVDMNLEYLDQDVNLRLNEKWQSFQPSQFDGKFDISIDVGVGTGSQEIQINQLINMMNVAAPGIEMGVVTKKNYYNMLSSIYELMGYKNTTKFVSDPNSQEAMQGNQQMQAMQQQFQQFQQQAQAKIAELTQKVQKLNLDKEVDLKKLQLQEAEMKLDYKIEIEKLKQEDRFHNIDTRLDIAKNTQRGTGQ